MEQPRRPRASTPAVVFAGCLLLAALVALPVGAAAVDDAGSLGDAEAVDPSTAGPAATTSGSPSTLADLRTSPAAPLTATQARERYPAPAQDVDADRTRIDVELEPDGDAVWTLELWTSLADDGSREAFATLQSDVADDRDAFVADFEERMHGTVAAASESTGRRMALRNVSVSTHTEAIPQEYGVLTYEFRWTGFAAVEDAELRAGDAIDAFLLEPGTRLTVRWPDEYRATSIEPAPDDRSDAAVVWRGDATDFVTGQPRLVVTSSDERGRLLPAAGLAALALLVLGAGWWLVRRGRLSLPGRSRDEPGTGGGEGPAADGAPPTDAPGAAGESEAGGPAASAADSDADASSPDAVTADAGSSDAGSPDSAGTDDGPPPELLSNEERVLRVLEANGGRMKQQQVIAELDWTEAKTSQVVTSMDEAGAIEKFRIGRENVLALPGEADL